MFQSKSKSDSSQPISSGSNTSFLGSGAVFTGNLEASGDVRIDGLLKGNLICKSKIVIGPQGAVEGDISGDQADIMGRVSGSVQVKELLHLRAKSVVTGNISAKQLQIEPEASFNGKCDMPFSGDKKQVATATSASHSETKGLTLTAN